MRSRVTVRCAAVAVSAATLLVAACEEDGGGVSATPSFPDFGPGPNQVEPAGREVFVEPLPDAAQPRLVDDREPLRAEPLPPPIGGGTLLVSRDGGQAFASDPDTDRVVFVDLVDRTLLGEVALEPGDRPGRLVQDGGGRLHVVLRGADEVATVDIAERSLSTRLPVCRAPRGIACEARTGLLRVACKDGSLVAVDPEAGEVVGERRLDVDLRDVVPLGDGLLVTRFRSAELLTLALPDAEPARHRPREVTQTYQSPALGVVTRSYAPAVARRAVSIGGGGALILHQRHLTDPLLLPEGTSGAQALTGHPRAYGPSDSCGSVVQAAVTAFDARAGITHSVSLGDVVLPVDVAMSPDGKWLAVADAGRRGQASTAIGATVAAGQQFQPVALLDLESQPLTTELALQSACARERVDVAGQPVALAFSPDGGLLVQTRTPAQLVIQAIDGGDVIELGSGSQLDTGHDLFHLAMGDASLACASCHAEAGDDGHIWHFAELGARRTQPLDVLLRDTAPYHWSGELPDLGAVMLEELAQRMGGTEQSDARVEALERFLFAQTSVRGPRDEDDPAVERGQRIFGDEEIGCVGCHGGEELTDNRSADVGRGRVQIPSLRGVAYRAPFLHDGCARDLEGVFDPACASDHGNTEDLSPAELDDLIAYLESI